MLRVVAGTLGLEGFGVIIAEIINSAQLLGIRVKPYIWWGVIRRLAMLANEGKNPF